MNYQSFLSTREIPASFDIGRKRINNAVLDFSNIDDETIMLCGIRQIKVYFQTWHSQKAAKLEASGEIADAGAWLEEKAKGFSESKIDLSSYIGRLSWDLNRAPGKPPIEKASSAVSQLSSMQDIEKLEKLLEERRKELKG